jgi:hypothetical protein
MRKPPANLVTYKIPNLVSISLVHLIGLVFGPAPSQMANLVIETTAGVVCGGTMWDIPRNVRDVGEIGSDHMTSIGPL